VTHDRLTNVFYAVIEVIALVSCDAMGGGSIGHVIEEIECALKKVNAVVLMKGGNRVVVVLLIGKRQVRRGVDRIVLRKTYETSPKR